RDGGSDAGQQERIKQTVALTRSRSRPSSRWCFLQAASEQCGTQLFQGVCGNGEPQEIACAGNSDIANAPHFCVHASDQGVHMFSACEVQHCIKAFSFRLMHCIRTDAELIVLVSEVRA